MIYKINYLAKIMVDKPIALLLISQQAHVCVSGKNTNKKRYANGIFAYLCVFGWL